MELWVCVREKALGVSLKWSEGPLMIKDYLVKLCLIVCFTLSTVTFALFVKDFVHS